MQPPCTYFIYVTRIYYIKISDFEEEFQQIESRKISRILLKEQKLNLRRLLIL